MGVSLPLLGVPGVLGGGKDYVGIAQRFMDDISGGAVGWLGQELTGSTIYAYNTALDEGRNIVLNGGFDADANWNKGAGWTISGGTATHAAGTDSNLIQYVVPTQQDYTYTLTFTISGRTAGSLACYCETYLGTKSANGVQTFSNFTANKNDANLIFYASADFDGSIDDVSVTQTGILASSAYPGGVGNPLNGTYTGVTLGQSWDLGVAPLYDGALDYGNVYSRTLNSFLNPDEGFLAVIGQASGPGVWTDNTARYLAILYADANNFIQHIKWTNNTLITTIRAGGTYSQVAYAVTPSTPFMMMLTWKKATNKMRAFYNGVQKGTDQPVGTWAGNLSGTQSVIGALNTSPTGVWSGLDGYIMLGRSEPAEAAITQLARDLGVYGT